MAETRPDPLGDPAYHLVPDPDTRLPEAQLIACRAHRGGGHGQERCGVPSVAQMRRPYYYSRSGITRYQWWGYCADHLAEYQRYVVDGQTWCRARIAEDRK
jgi:hypothetical protein